MARVNLSSFRILRISFARSTGLRENFLINLWILRSLEEALILSEKVLEIFARETVWQVKIPRMTWIKVLMYLLSLKKNHRKSL